MLLTDNKRMYISLQRSDHYQEAQREEEDATSRVLDKRRDALPLS